MNWRHWSTHSLALNVFQMRAFVCTDNSWIYRPINFQVLQL